MKKVLAGGIPHFGTRQDGIEYIQRPSVYAIIQDSNRKIAIVKHRGAFFLPGGGIEGGETPIEALRREMFEELGYAVIEVVKLSEAIEYLQGVLDGGYYCIHSTFFTAQLGTKIPNSIEPDHQLIWMRPENAIPKMQRDCHSWVIESLKPEESDGKIRNSS